MTNSIQGIPVSPTPPTANQVMEFVGGLWTPTTPSPGGISTLTSKMVAIYSAGGNAINSLGLTYNADSIYINGIGASLDSGRLLMPLAGNYKVSILSPFGFPAGGATSITAGIYYQSGSTPIPMNTSPLDGSVYCSGTTIINVDAPGARRYMFWAMTNAGNCVEGSPSLAIFEYLD